MTPTDPRHGTYAGAVAHWFDSERPCGACAPAEWRYRKRRKLEALRGQHRTVPAQGTIRRLQALHAIGYTGPQIAEQAGLSIATLRSIQHHGAQTVHRATAAAVAVAYERICMTRPEGGYAGRARNMARRRGWAPPLAWDDIDDPAEIPAMADDPINETSHWMDEAIVVRVLGGETSLARVASAAERAEIAARWTASGRPLRDLASITGWKPERYWRATA